MSAALQIEWPIRRPLHADQDANLNARLPGKPQHQTRAEKIPMLMIEFAVRAVASDCNRVRFVGKQIREHHFPRISESRTRFERKILRPLHEMLGVCNVLFLYHRVNH